MIYNIPIEPLEERYSAQWARWFPEAFINAGVEYREIRGSSLTTRIETGSVLDVFGTHHYKFSQLQIIMKMLREKEIKDGDTLLFHDLWFPGIESLEYVRNMTGISFKIAGILHAGSWDPDDFVCRNGMRPWARPIEFGWMKIFDHVFLGSRFHRELIERDFLLPAQTMDAKFHVTGLPFDFKEVKRDPFAKKERLIVFPHRLDVEKCPEKFDTLAKACARDGWSFVKTKDVCKTKDEYYDLLNRAALSVSTAEQETFGYAMLESMANGCYPLVPFSKSYASMHIYRGHYYDDFDDLVARTVRFMDESDLTYKDFSKSLACYAPNVVIREMLSYL